jgi:hypothetical protein
MEARKPSEKPSNLFGVHAALIERIARYNPNDIRPAALREDILELNCILAWGCDCQNPHGVGIRHVSEDCPVHSGNVTAQGFLP